MFRPSREEFVRLASQGNLVPVVREILADLETPLSLFRKLDDGATSFLFESVEGGEKWARYSFVGTGARAVYEARDGAASWTEDGRTREF
ncbi:MAG: anthranilate synthase component I, partial [Myxococcota bacterium]